MRFRVHVEGAGRGRIVATCADLPGCRAEGSTREEALERIRNAIAYYQEMCPCDVTSEAGVELEVIDATPR
jgi:predicted RNase H-like HicB family nuclease